MKAYGHFLMFSVLVVTLGLALGGCEREPPALAATPPPVVTVSRPLEREVTDYYEYTGRTAAVDAGEVRARVSGYLVKVNFQEGSVVKKGDLLFQIDPRLFQAVLDQAKGQVAQWEAKLARAEALLAAPDQHTWAGRRDYAFMLLAVQTGLRLSEMTGLTRQDLMLGVGAHVRVMGKGRKERCTPVARSTLAVLKA